MPTLKKNGHFRFWDLGGPLKSDSGEEFQVGPSSSRLVSVPDFNGYPVNVGNPKLKKKKMVKCWKPDTRREPDTNELATLLT